MKLTLATLFATSFVLGVAGFACGRTADASPSTSQAAPGKSSDSKEGKWAASIKPVGTYKVGDNFFEIVLTTSGEFHVNDDYPTKFKTGDAPANVTYPSTTLSRKDNKDAFTTDACKADKDHACTIHVKVPFKATKAGKVTVGGTLNIGVCSPANCLVEKVALDLDVDVK
jgi:hypothetical protein